MQVADFAKDLSFSQSADTEPTWESFYRSLWPDLISTHRVDGKSDWQSAGIDRIILLPGMRQVWVDEKIRRVDYGDFLLERWSNLQRKKPGWTIDPHKRTDYVAYAVLPARRCYVLPYDLLRRTCTRHLSDWCHAGTERIARNPNYTTVNYSVPWGTLFLGMVEEMARPFLDYSRHT